MKKLDELRREISVPPMTPEEKIVWYHRAIDLVAMLDHYGLDSTSLKQAASEFKLRHGIHDES